MSLSVLDPVMKKLMGCCGFSSNLAMKFNDKSRREASKSGRFSTVGRWALKVTSHDHKLHEAESCVGVISIMP